MSAQYPKFMDCPGDYELLESTWTYDKAKERLHHHAKHVKRLGQTKRFGVRLGQQDGEWEIILTDEDLKGSGKGKKR
ncbi:hypothetical protein [Streptomyces wuyuanensis]|uniref:hypothetical protein n=1 Tax=Streptomyces wuyuanensis TaxID=1196353 RepID=UPI003447B400